MFLFQRGSTGHGPCALHALRHPRGFLWESTGTGLGQALGVCQPLGCSVEKALDVVMGWTHLGENPWVVETCLNGDHVMSWISVSLSEVWSIGPTCLVFAFPFVFQFSFRLVNPTELGNLQGCFDMVVLKQKRKAKSCWHGGTKNGQMQDNASPNLVRWWSPKQIAGISGQLALVWGIFVSGIGCSYCAWHKTGIPIIGDIGGVPQNRVKTLVELLSTSIWICF